MGQSIPARPSERHAFFLSLQTHVAISTKFSPEGSSAVKRETISTGNGIYACAGGKPSRIKLSQLRQAQERYAVLSSRSGGGNSLLIALEHEDRCPPRSSVCETPLHRRSAADVIGVRRTATAASRRFGSGVGIKPQSEGIGIHPCRTTSSELTNCIINGQATLPHRDTGPYSRRPVAPAMPWRSPSGRSGDQFGCTNMAALTIELTRQTTLPALLLWPVRFATPPFRMTGRQGQYLAYDDCNASGVAYSRRLQA